MEIVIKSPVNLYHCLTEPANYIHLSSDIFNLIGQVIALYQSPLGNVPVRRGKLFLADTVDTKPKFGRSIGQIQIVLDAMPLIISYTQELDDALGELGLRGRAEMMQLDLVLVQKLQKTMNRSADAAEKESSIHRVVRRWTLEQAEVKLTEVEVRVVKFSPESNPRARIPKEDFENWKMSSDFEKMNVWKRFEMIPFMWAPKFVYYRRDDQEVVDLNKSKTLAAFIFVVDPTQTLCLRKRLREIEASIRSYLEIQRTLQNRMTVISSSHDEKVLFES
jgi:hypothetical protein